MQADLPPTETMSLLEPVKCTFSEMLDYLVKSGSIMKTKAEDLKKIIGVDAIDIAKMLVIFTGPDWATNFISSLPVDNPIFAGDLIAANFEAMCSESTIGWDGIQSIAFDISSTPLRPKLEWTIPFDISTPDQAYLFVHTSNFRITVQWPAYLMRTASGNYRGTLAYGGITHYVVGQFTVQDPEGAKYSMAFTDDKYETKGYSLSVGKLLNFFNCPEFPFDEQKGWMAAALVADLLKALNLLSDLTNPSFVLELQSNVSVKEIAGCFPLKIDFDSLKLLPFKLDAIPLEFTKLQVVLRDIGSPDIRTLLLQQHGKIFKPPGIPFRLSLGLSAEQPYYEVAIVPDGVNPVPIKQILKAFGLSSTITDEDFSFIENLSTALAISNASVGWTDEELHYLSLAVEIADWKLADGNFVVQNFLLELRAVAPASKDNKRLYFYGSGTFKISDIEIELVWDLDRNDLGTVINFQVATAQRPISVGSILGHFNIKESLPESFVHLLDATNVDGVTLQVVKDTSGWSISRFALEMDIRAELDIFSQFKLAYPKFAVDVADPFNSRGKRGFSAVIKATFVIEEELTCNASLKISNTKRGLLVMDLEADESQPVNMGSLFKLFGLDFQGVSIPDSVSFLLLIGLTKFNLSLEFMNNKWGMNELSVTAISLTSLQIWKELKLDRLSLEFLYSKYLQRKAATVKALLSFGTEADLDVGFNYTGPSTIGVPDPQPTPDNIEISTVEGASWKAEVTYPGTVSLLSALSRVTKVDIRKELVNVGLQALRDVMNVDLSDPKITLVRAKDQTSFSFSSGVNTKYFSGNVDLSCSRSTSWIYDFAFEFNSKNFFKDLEIDKLVLDDATIRLTNGSSNRKALVDTVAGDRNPSVEFSGKLAINELTKNLESFVKSVELIGSITSNSFSIWAKTNDFTLFDNSLTLSGEVGAMFVTSPSRTLQVGLKGTVKDIDLHDISSEKFTVSFGFFIQLPNPQLGLEFESASTLKDAFKVKDLVIKALKFNAFFQEFPFPSSVHISVEEVSFKDTFDGSLEVYYNESKLTDCYAKGLFTNDKLEFSKSLSAVYDKNKPVTPKCVDGNFFGLLFWVTWATRALQVPQPDGTEKEQQIQGFYLKGDLNFSSIDFSALFIISITTQDPIGVLVHGSIKNAIVAPSTGNTLFALRDAGDKKLGPYLTLMLVQGKLPYFEVSCEVYFLGLTLSTNVKLSLEGFELHEKMSFTGSDVLKTELKFDIIINKTQFEFKAGCYLDIEIKDCKIGDIAIPNLTVVKLDASLSTTINWSSDPQWTLAITASADIFNHHLPDLRFSLTVKDLKDLVEQLVVQLPKALVEKALEYGIEEATRFLKDLGLAVEEASKLLVNVFNQARDEVVRAAGQIYALAKEDVEKILKDLGAAADEIARVLKELGLDFEDFITDLPEDFDKWMREIAKDVEKALEMLINLIGGITPRQIKVLRELDEAEAKIRSYLEQVERRNGEIIGIISKIEGNIQVLQTTQQSILGLTNKAKTVADDASFEEQLDNEERIYLTTRREELEKARDKWKADCEEVEKR